ncbi:unnamed protein product [Darwinula stevensoni]|uniref:Uncharacterized protein n=1 Tax=Darwinula stevensoni TaxID=69355 RepID=A0A7R8X6T3_9CRUS|nr:unnamed protein product [Darwinula stevensoni]CAG0886100.1 unnamed protein product [Darwinula stevensoni]
MKTNSWLLSLAVRHDQQLQLEKPLQLTFRNEEPPRVPPYGKGRDQTICECSHLTNFAVLIDINAQAPNETSALETLKNLTSWIENEVELSGEEIQNIVNSLAELLDDFLVDLQNGQGDPSDSKEFLQILTVAVDLTLDAFEGWLNIMEGTRSETFSSLTETMAKAGLEIAYLLFNHHDEELAFNMSKKHLVVEAWGKPKNSGSFVFPNGRGHTYAELPDGFQDQLVGGDHYFVVGVLYDVEELNSLLPSDNTSFGAEMKTDSWLLSLSLKHDRPELELKNPLQLTFQNKGPPRDLPYRSLHQGKKQTVPESFRCAFWNVEDERWDDRGCSMVSLKKNQTICRCSHLTDFAVLVLNETSTFEKLDNLTSWIENEEDLTGEEIQTIVNSLDDLLDDFLNDLENDLGGSFDPVEFLRKLTVIVDLTLDAFDGWLNITEGVRSETFSSLTETVAKAGLEVAYFMFNHRNEELAFNMSREHLKVEACGKLKNSGSFVFPNGRGHTYAVLPDGFQDQLGGGDHYFVVGVLYEVDDLNALLPADGTLFGGETKTNSQVLSLAVKHDRQLDLKNPLRLTFRNEVPPRDPPYREVWRDPHEGEPTTFVSQSHQCTFWNIKKEKWDDEGCWAVSSDRDETVCECKHLTNFAVLMDIHGYVGRTTALEMLSISLSSLSILGLVLALLIFITVDVKSTAKLRALELNKHLCLCLLAAHPCLILLMDRQIFNFSETGCAVSGVVLHYLFLSAFTWMALEGIFVYRRLVLVFPTGTSISVWTYYIAGYCLPGLVVLVTAAVSFLTNTRGYGAGEFCWLSSPYYIWAFAGPVLLVILANFIIMCLVMKSVWQRGNVGRSPQRSHVAFVRTTLTLSCLLGIGWVFGFLYMQITPVFAYFFTIANASQARHYLPLRCASAERARYRWSCVWNLETLSKRPSEKGIDVQKALLDFHDKWYSANIMTLCVLGKESLEELEERVVELFSGVKNKDIQAPEWLDHPYKEPQLRKVLEVLPVKDIRELTLTFPIPDYKQFYRSAPEHYLSHLIGHKGPGSILSLLKEKGWVNTLVAGKYAGAPGFAFFQVNVDLTEDGLEHTEEIAEIIFQYLKLLHVSGPQEWIFEECRNLSSIDFRFKDKENPINYVVQVTLSLREYPIDEVLSGPYLFDQFKPELISEVLGLLIPDRVRLTVIAKKFEGTTVHKEEWYGIEYSISDIYPEVIKKWAHLNMHTELALPPKNEFIPTNFVLHTLPKDAKKTPQLIENSPLFRVWYKQDDRYFRPKAILKFQFVSPLAYLDPTHCNMNNLLVWLFRDALNEYAHSAQVAGLNYSLDCSKYGLQLTIYGFSDKQHVLLDKIMDKLTHFKANPKRFILLKELYERSLKNFKAEQPMQHACYYLSQLTTDRSWSMEDLLQALPQITVHNLENFVNSFLSHLHVECLIHGNLTQKQADGYIDVLRSYLTEKGSTRSIPLFPSQIIQDREVQLLDGDNFLYSQPHEVHESSCVMIYFQCLVEDTHNNMLVGLFCQIINELCFDVLRTKEQLGYLVFSGVRQSNGVQGVAVIVQSLYDPEYLNSRIEAFLDYVQVRHDFIYHESKKRRKLAIYVQSKVKPKDQPSSLELHGAPSLKVAKTVVDIVEFKRHQGLYPLAKSYLDVPVIGRGLSKLDNPEVMRMQESLHQNLILLGLKDLAPKYKIPFAEVPFRVPNRTTFLAVAHFLSSYCKESKELGVPPWPLQDKKQEAQFVNAFTTLMQTLKKNHEEAGLPSVSTVIWMQPGGVTFLDGKFIHPLLMLSQFILHQITASMSGAGEVLRLSECDEESAHSEVEMYRCMRDNLKIFLDKWHPVSQHIILQSRALENKKKKLIAQLKLLCKKTKTKAADVETQLAEVVHKKEVLVAEEMLREAKDMMKSHILAWEKLKQVMEGSTNAKIVIKKEDVSTPLPEILKVKFPREVFEEGLDKPEINELLRIIKAGSLCLRLLESTLHPDAFDKGEEVNIAGVRAFLQDAGKLLQEYCMSTTELQKRNSELALEVSQLFEKMTEAETSFTTENNELPIFPSTPLVQHLARKRFPVDSPQIPYFSITPPVMQVGHRTMLGGSPVSTNVPRNNISMPLIHHMDSTQIEKPDGPGLFASIFKVDIELPSMKIKLPPIPQTPPLAREEMLGQASAKQIGNHHPSSVFDLAIPWTLDRDEHFNRDDPSTTQGFGIDESMLMDPPVLCQPPQSLLSVSQSDVCDSRGQASNKTELDQDSQTPPQTTSIESKAQERENHRPQQNGDIQGKVPFSCLSATGIPQSTVSGSSKDEGFTSPACKSPSESVWIQNTTVFENQRSETQQLDLSSVKLNGADPEVQAIVNRYAAMKAKLKLQPLKD